MHFKSLTFPIKTVRCLPCKRLRNGCSPVKVPTISNTKLQVKYMAASGPKMLPATPLSPIISWRDSPANVLFQQLNEKLWSIAAIHVSWKHLPLDGSVSHVLNILSVTIRFTSFKLHFNTREMTKRFSTANQFHAQRTSFPVNTTDLTLHTLQPCLHRIKSFGDLVSSLGRTLHKHCNVLWTGSCFEWAWIDSGKYFRCFL
jgi:hypothetical protein